MSKSLSLTDSLTNRMKGLGHSSPMEMQVWLQDHNKYLAFHYLEDQEQEPRRLKIQSAI